MYHDNQEEGVGDTGHGEERDDDKEDDVIDEENVEMCGGEVADLDLMNEVVIRSENGEYDGWDDDDGPKVERPLVMTEILVTEPETKNQLIALIRSFVIHAVNLSL